MVLDQVFNEDCLIGMDRIPDKSVDMILCDLPYGTTENKWDSAIPLDRLWEQYKRVLKRGGAVVLTCQIPFMIDLANSNREWLRYEWIWQKSNPTGFLNANRMPMKCHENVLVFYENLGKYNPQGIKQGRSQVSGSHSTNYGEYATRYKGLGKNYGEDRHRDYNVQQSTYDGLVNYPRDVILFKKEGGIHPTQKPVALFEYLIRTYTDEGDVVLDNCMGSGTTAVACIRSGRHYIGFETDPVYYDVINERISETKHIFNNNLDRWF